METTKNELSPFAKKFFDKMRRYLDTPIYFYGSIQRYDYFPKSSDIDVDIFAENEKSIIAKLQNFLGVPKSSFEKFVFSLNSSNKLIQGYKVGYTDPANKFSTEIEIYNIKDKPVVLKEHNAKTILPIYITILLLIIKCLYYEFEILPKPLYKYMKRIVMNYMLEGKDVEFVTMSL